MPYQTLVWCLGTPQSSTVPFIISVIQCICSMVECFCRNPNWWSGRIWVSSSIGRNLLSIAFSNVYNKLMRLTIEFLTTVTLVFILWRIDPLLGNDSVNTFPWESTHETIGRVLLGNGSVNTPKTIRDNRGRCFPWDPLRGYVTKSSKAVRCDDTSSSCHV
jgi:hypothetical protein